MRLKKNISANGNYTLSKAAPNQGGANNGQGQGDSKEEAKNRAQSVGGPKPNNSNSVDKMKKNNLTASNPIIGAPLATQLAKKTEKIFPSIQLKGKDASLGKGVTASQSMKPALTNAKIPKYIKKTLKFAKGVDGVDSPGRNSNADQ
jgi:hypothetical protein